MDGHDDYGYDDDFDGMMIMMIDMMVIIVLIMIMN